MRFDADEVERIEDAQLVIAGVAPSELRTMPAQLRYDVLALKQAQEELLARKK